MSIVKVDLRPPQEPALRASWPTRVTNRVVPDASGNGKNGTMITPIAAGCSVWESDPYFGDVLRCFGADPGSGFNYSCALGITSVGSFAFLVTPYSIAGFNGFFGGWTGQDLISFGGAGNTLRAELLISGVSRSYAAGATTRVGVPIFSVVTYDGTNIRLYIDGALIGTSPNYTSVLSGFNANTGRVGRYGGGVASLNGTVQVLGLYNRVLSGTEISDWYSRAKLACYKADWGSRVSTASEGGVIGRYLSNTPWQFADTLGRFRVELDTIEGRPCKVIRCYIAGMLYLDRSVLQSMPGGAAFGEWDFWYYKGPGAAMALAYISSRGGSANSANHLYVAPGREVGSQRYNPAGGWAANNFQTAAGYYPAATWARLRLKRNTAGVGTCYMNEQLVSTVGGANTNPFTDATYLTSENIGLLMGIGDRFCLSDISGGHAFTKRVKG